MVEFDFGKVENIIGFNKYIEEKLSEKQKIIDEQQATIKQLKEENIELKKLRKYCAEWMGVKEENLYDVVR